MPRVRILTGIAGADASYRRGEVVDLSKELASQWCDGVRAELVRGQKAETPESGARRAEKTAAASRRRRTAEETSDADTDAG